MKPRKQYSWRYAVAVSNGLVHAARHNELLGDMLKAGPAATYAGLLHYAQAKNYNPGWAAHSFKEIFGTWPRPQDRKAEPTPLPNFLIDEWAASHKRRR
jgi:hypothetical protein